MTNRCFRLLAATVLSLGLVSHAAGAANPDEQIASIVTGLLAKGGSPGWRSIEKLPGITWAPLPPTMLDTCLPDGGCFTRAGTLAMGDRTIIVLATGARGFVLNLYLRNQAAPLGEAAVLAALQRAGLSAELARCPVPSNPSGTKWYQLKSGATAPGFLLIQSSCDGKPCEAFVVTVDDRLRPLPPKEQSLYTEQCPPAGGAR